MTKKIITNTNTNEELIKKSTFIGVCAHIESPEQFFQFLDQYQDLTATHNCWAYRIGNEYRFNDDGEPSGTAGKPILAAIDGAGFDFTAALVIRYYGGIKLGTGGLARAYGGTIAKNLSSAPHSVHVPQVTLTVTTPFEYSQQLYRALGDINGQHLNQDYNESGVISQVSVPVESLSAFKTDLLNACKGQAYFSDPLPES